MAGKRWSKGGKYRRNKLAFDISSFANLIEQLEEAQADVKEVLTEAFESAGEDIGVRTKEAMADKFLPAKGEYSQGDTEKTVILNPKAKWHGSAIEIGVGFDKTKNGVGSLLITGTPRMRPDYELEKIFVNKKYMKQLTKQIGDDLTEVISENMGG